MNTIRIYRKYILLVLCMMLGILCPFNIHAEEYYWENPEKITSGDCRFPQGISNNNSSAVFWQEVDTSKSQVFISCAFKMADSTGKDYGWRYHRRFAGPFTYSGEVPDMYSAAMNANGKIVVSVLAESNVISVFTSNDGGASFVRNDFAKTDLPLVAPRVYAMNSGEFILFTSLGKDESFSMLSSKSRDGITWQNFSTFEPTKNLTNPFLPVLVSGDKGELLLFQAQLNSGTRLSYQLYATHSR